MTLPIGETVRLSGSREVVTSDIMRNDRFGAASRQHVAMRQRGLGTLTFIGEVIHAHAIEVLSHASRSCRSGLSARFGETC